MTDCKHERGAGFNYCPDCGACLHWGLWLARSMRNTITDPLTGYPSLTATRKVFEECIAWVERKIAEEKGKP